jgi:membrane associated rhomboid family serine protease
VTVFVFSLEMFFSDNIVSIFGHFGINSNFSNIFDLKVFSLWFLTIFTYMFFHGDFLHLLSNMWTIYVIGKVVEHQLGSYKYLFLYLAGGALSGIIVPFCMLSSSGIYIGASAAISSVLGVFIVTNFRSKMFILFPVIILPLFIEIPSVVFVIFWAGLQLLLGIAKSANSQMVPTNTEYWSHIAGFLIGVLFCPISLTFLFQKITITANSFYKRMSIFLSR